MPAGANARRGLRMSKTLIMMQRPGVDAAAAVEGTAAEVQATAEDQERVTETFGGRGRKAETAVAAVRAVRGIRTH